MADISLKAVTPDVMKILLEEQKKEKERRGTNQYSLSRTIIKIIKEWNNKCKPVE